MVGHGEVRHDRRFRTHTAPDATDQEILDAILDAIDAYWVAFWTSPSVRELADQIGLGVAATHRRLGILVDNGHLEKKIVTQKKTLYRRRIPRRDV